LKAGERMINKSSQRNHVLNLIMASSKEKARERKIRKLQPRKKKE